MAIVWKIITIYAIFSLFRLLVTILRNKVKLSIYTSMNQGPFQSENPTKKPHNDNTVEAEFRVLSEE